METARHERGIIVGILLLHGGVALDARGDVAIALRPTPIEARQAPLSVLPAAVLDADPGDTAGGGGLRSSGLADASAPALRDIAVSDLDESDLPLPSWSWSPNDFASLTWRSSWTRVLQPSVLRPARSWKALGNGGRNTSGGTAAAAPTAGLLGALGLLLVGCLRRYAI